MRFETQCTSWVDGVSMAIKATEVLIISEGPGQTCKIVGLHRVVQIALLCL